MQTVKNDEITMTAPMGVMTEDFLPDETVEKDNGTTNVVSFSDDEMKSIAENVGPFTDDMLQDSPADGMSAEELKFDAQDGAEDDGEDNEQYLVDNKDVRSFVSKTFEAMKKLECARDAINSDLKAELDRMEVKGINRKAAKAAYKRFKLSDEERESMDFSYAVCCNAVGVQPQRDLFERQSFEDMH